MNSVDMATNLINRAKNLHKYIVETDVPEDFRFNGTVPFDIQIKDNVISAEVYAIDFNEAVTKLDSWLETCK
jgi:hypothetical protein